MNVKSKLLYFEDNLLVFIDNTDYASLWQIISRKYNYKYSGFVFFKKHNREATTITIKLQPSMICFPPKVRRMKINKRINRN